MTDDIPPRAAPDPRLKEVRRLAVEIRRDVSYDVAAATGLLADLIENIPTIQGETA